MSNCKCKSINCDSSGRCDVITQDSKNRPQFYFSAVPHNVMDSMCGGCDIRDVSIHNTDDNCGDNSFYDHKRSFNNAYNQRGRLFKHFNSRNTHYGKNDEYLETTYSCNDQRCQNLDLSCRKLPNGTKVYTEKRNSSYVVPEEFTFNFRNHSIHGVPFKHLQMEGHLLWLYNLEPHQTYTFKFDTHIFKRTANKNGILFLLENSEFPLGNFKTASVDKDNTNLSVTNSFLSSCPFSYRSVNGPFLSEEQFTKKLIQHSENATDIMCAVTYMKNGTNVVYENGTYLFL
tara:strand:+ start:1131 stop:1991 length:861 start_codon:yes stop_codon:yes gene_type:complete